MTVNNGSIATMLVAPGAAGEMLAGANGLAADATAATLPGEENVAEFWTMVTQNLSQILEGKDLQVIESKDIVAALEDLPTEAMVVPENMPPVLWRQFLQAGISDVIEGGAELDLTVESLSTEELQALVSEVEEQLPAPPMMPQAAIVEGESLPVRRQTAAAAAVAIAPVAKSISPPPDQRSVHSEPSELAVSAVSAEPVEGDGEIPLPGKQTAAPQQQPQSQAQAQEQVLLRQAGASSNEAQVAAVKTADGMVLPLQSSGPLHPAPHSGATVAPEMQSITLPTNANQQQWGQALGERVAFLINQKMNSAEIRIDPPHLGKLDIQIQLKDDSAVVVIQTQHAQTRDLIDNSTVRLREFLQQAGYDSVDVNVSHRDSSPQQEQSGESYAGAALSDAEESASISPLESGVMTPVSMSFAQGRIDYFA